MTWRRRTWCQVVSKTYANLALGVGGDCEARLAIYVPFREVDVSLGCRVDDFNVDALAGAGPDVGGDNDECVWVGCVPYTF